MPKNPRMNEICSWRRGCRSAFIYLLTLVLAGCEVGPDYKRPAVNSPPAYRGGQPNGSNALADLPWWEIFHDENLQGLIRTALTNNYDVRVAVTRRK